VVELVGVELLGELLEGEVHGVASAGLAGRGSAEAAWAGLLLGLGGGSGAEGKASNTQGGDAGGVRRSREGHSLAGSSRLRAGLALGDDAVAFGHVEES
jgi:hypothetical protein